MKKTISSIPLFILLFLFNPNCIHAQSARELAKDSEASFASQLFNKAVVEATAALMKDPEYTRAIEALQQALPACIRSNENRIAQLKESTAKFSGDITVEECQKIVECYSNLALFNEKILNLPVIKQKRGNPIKFEIKSYSSELRQAKEELLRNQEFAAERHYQIGNELLKQNDIEKQKLAAKEFIKANTYISDYKDSRTLYEQAKKAAIKRIAIIPFENKSGKNQYGSINETITDKIISELTNDKLAMEFIEIITRDQLQQVLQEQNLGQSGIINENSAMQVGKILGVSEIIVGQITQIASSEPIVTSKQYQQERSMYSQQGNYLVRAIVTENKREASASLSCSFKIIDVKTAKLIKSDSSKEDYRFVSVWATFVGNKEAIGYGVPTTQEQNAPSDEERINILVDQIAPSLYNKIKVYVR